MPYKPQSRGRLEALQPSRTLPDPDLHVSDGRGNRDGVVTWRFHRDANREWRWERTAAGERVARKASGPFARYEQCVMNAQSMGYKPMAAVSNLVPLSLVSDPQPIPGVLHFDVGEPCAESKARSTVLKKRVAHPAIEKMYSKNSRTPAVTRKREAAHARRGSASMPANRLHPRSHVKSRIGRA